MSSRLLEGGNLVNVNLAGRQERLPKIRCGTSVLVLVVVTAHDDAEVLLAIFFLNFLIWLGVPAHALYRVDDCGG